MAKETFIEAVALITAEDQQLRSALAESEAQVETSVTAMQADFNRLTVATQKSGQSAASAGQVFGAFGAQMSAVGGIAGNVGGKVAGLGGALAGLGPALLGPAGAILVLTAGLGILIQRFVSARDKAKELKDELRRLEQTERELAKAQAKTLATREAAATARAQLAEDRLRGIRAGARGPEAVIFEQERLQLRDIRERVAANRAAGFLPRTEEANRRLRAEGVTLIALRVAIEKETQRKVLAIREAAKKLTRDKEIAAEILHQARLAAIEARRAARPRTVGQQIQDVISGILSRERLQGDVESILQSGRVGPRFVDQIRAFFGIAGPTPIPARAAGAGQDPFAFLTGSGAAGGGDPVTRERLALAKQTAANTKKIAEHTDPNNRPRTGVGD